MNADREANLAVVAGVVPRGRGSLGVVAPLDAAARRDVDVSAYIRAVERVHRRGVNSGVRAARALEGVVAAAVAIERGGRF